MHEIFKCLALLLIASVTVNVRLSAHEPQKQVESSLQSFQNALEQASKERKYVVVTLYASDCPDCDRLQETMRSPVMNQWLDRRGVLCTLNTTEIEGKQFADKYELDRFPLVMLFSNDGKSLGKRFGYAEPSDLARALDRLSQSDDAIGGPGLSPSEGYDVLLAAIERGKRLTQLGQYADALGEFSWCLSHRVAQTSLFEINALPDLAVGMVELSKVYPAAEKEIQRRLSDAEKEVLQSARPSTFALYWLKSVYTSMDRESRLVELYDEMKGKSSTRDSAGDFGRFIYGALLGARRYEDLAWSVENPEDVMTFFDQARREKRRASEVRKLMAARYEVLLGLEKYTDAQMLSQTMERFDRTPSAAIAFAEAALRSGHPTSRDISNVRNGYIATGGRDLKTVILLARILAVENPKNRESPDLIHSAMRRATSPEDRKALAICLRDIRSGNAIPK